MKNKDIFWDVFTSRENESYTISRLANNFRDKLSTNVVAHRERPWWWERLVGPSRDLERWYYSTGPIVSPFQRNSN